MPVYTELAPDEIKVSHFNPAKRVDRNKLTGLILSIREYGILQPLALTHDRVLADGHRRHAAAKYLKLHTVPVAIYTENRLDAATLWVVLNSDTMNLTPTQWLAAVDAGLSMDTPGFPEVLRKRVERLQALIGKEGIATLVEQGRSPYLADNAERLVRYCDRRNDEEFFKLAVLWLVTVSNSFNLRAAMEDDIPPDVLVDAIEQGVDIKRSWEVSDRHR